jgi:uncharacterized membrane protein YdbT with pleckstrin-like domain
VRAGDLLPGERVLLTAHQHGVVLLRPFALTPLAVLAVLVALFLLPLHGELHLFFSLAALLIGVLILNLYYWRWRAHEYVVTDQRVILNEGVLARFSRSIAIDRIQDLTVYQGLWGRTWGFGDVELESAGREGGEWLHLVPQPQQVRNVIFSQIEARRRSYS